MKLPLRAAVLGNKQRRFQIGTNLDGGVDFMIEGMGIFKMAPTQAIEVAQGLLEAAGVKLEKVDPRQLLQG